MKRIFALCLLFPLTLCAMDEASKKHQYTLLATDETPKQEDLYVGIIAQVLNRLERNKRVDIYPIASTTFIYKLPHDHTENTRFEYVDTIDDLNPPIPDKRMIQTDPDSRSVVPSVVLSSINFSHTEKHKVVTRMINLYCRSGDHNHHPSIPLGHVYLFNIWGGWTAKHKDLKPAKFDPAPTVRFLPGSTFEQGENIIESTVPNESLAKCPTGNSPAVTIAFLKMMQQYDNEKQRMVYVPEGTQNKDHRE
jgi:hypothetical protein